MHIEKSLARGTVAEAEDASTKACAAFMRFVRMYDADFESRYLSAYIWQWIVTGDAVEVCGGDYGTFMCAHLFIVVAYYEDPSILDYRKGKVFKKRRVEVILPARFGRPPDELRDLRGLYLRPEEWAREVRQRIARNPRRR